MENKVIKSSKVSTKGILASMSVALSQGVESLVFPLFGLIFISSIVSSPAFAAAEMSVKELLIGTFSFMFFGHLVRKTFKKVKENKKTALVFFISSAVGTAFGNIFLILAIQTGGSSYGPILTSMYPIFSMIALKAISKEKESWKVWFGVGISIMGALMFTLIPLAVLPSSDFSKKQVFGLLLGLTAGAFWSTEGIAIHFGIKDPKKKELFNKKEITIIRVFGTNMSVQFIIIPICFAFGNPYKEIGRIFSNWESILICMFIAINALTLRLIYISTIKMNGPKLSASIDTNHFIVPTVFSEVLMFLPIHALGSSEALYEPVVWWSYFFLIPVFLGVILVIFNHGNREIENKIIDEHILPQ